jgi:hypothetical protein
VRENIVGGSGYGRWPVSARDIIQSAGLETAYQDIKTGYAPPAVGFETGYGWDGGAATRRWFHGDFDDDGDDDVAFVWAMPANSVYDYPHVMVSKLSSRADGTWSESTFETGYGWDGNDATRRWFVGDFNRDRRDDLLFVWAVPANAAYSYTHVGVATLRSTSGGAWTTSNTFETGYGWNGDDANRRWFGGDVDGDGRADILFAWNLNNKVALNAILSKGDGTFRTTMAQDTGYGWDGSNASRRWFSGDFNRDSKTDLAFAWDYAGNVAVNSLFSNGNGTFSTHWTHPSPYVWDGNDASRRWFAGDFDGDEDDDIAFTYSAGGALTYVSLLSQGNAKYAPFWFRTPHRWVGDDQSRKWFVGDANEDGRDDIVFVGKRAANSLWGYDHTSVTSIEP